MDHTAAEPAAHELDACRLVLAHGAGSDARFLELAFPADRLGVRETVVVDDRTGRIDRIMTALAHAAADPVPTILGGVSLGAHAAAALLARPDLPRHVVAGLLVMPAWTGHPDPVADLTHAAGDALAVLGPEGVLAELDPDDWVTPQLARAWAHRTAADLVQELLTAATQDAPDAAAMASISVPCAIVALADDPLHPVSVATRWQQLIPTSEQVSIPREGPGDGLWVFATAAREALLRLQF